MRTKVTGIVAFVLAWGASSPTAASDTEKTYLLSLVDLPIGEMESMGSFRFDTWGVTFHKICRFPNSWSLEAGVGATPQGVFAGEGSVGASWFQAPNNAELQGVALISFWGPVTQEEIRTYEGAPELPAWFAGTAHLSGPDGALERQISGKNIEIVAADDCP